MSDRTSRDRMTGQRYLAEALHAYGVTHVFFVPSAFTRGTAALDRLGIGLVVTHGEKAAAYMADGYARATRRPGICFAQNIGASNLAAGLRDAFMAGSPVIALTGGPSPITSSKQVYQQVDDLSAFDSVTKMNAVVEDVRRLPDMLRQAFRVATTGAPGPVHLRIPGSTGESLNAEFACGPEQGPLAEKRFASYPAFRPEADAASVAAAVELLTRAERPVMVVGGGARVSGAEAEVLELARTLSIPVATSMNAKGIIDERHPLAVGVVGSYSRDSANRAVMEADLVFFVGSHAGSQVTDKWRLPKPGTTVIQLDIDPAELGRHYPNAASLLGDARTVLRRMIAAVPARVERAAWCARAASFVEDWRRETEPDRTSDAIPIRPERIAEDVSRALPRDGILLSDTGHSGIWTAAMVDLAPTQSFLRCAGSLGWAFPAAIGAGLAAPERPVVAFTGDGGFYYHLGELETAARYGANVTIVVNDNRALSQNVTGFRQAFDGDITEGGNRMWRFLETDLAGTARALGCRAFAVDRPGDLRGALAEAVAFAGPAIVVVAADARIVAKPPYGGQDFYSSSTAKS